MTEVLPFDGVKVLDLGTFWAGPFVGCYLGAFGADVIKVESVRRPDAFRYNTAFPDQGPDWYERSGLFQATNLNKRGLTLDLTDPRAREIFDGLLVECDVIFENFSPRVIEQLGLSWEHVHEVNPGAVMVRMPGFGIEGPWRDFVGFGNSFEHVGGLTAATGYADSQPLGPGGYADPIVALHSLVAIQAALEQRTRTGVGQVIELAQIEVVAALAAEQVLTASTTGKAPQRRGNRSPAMAPQGVYPCADHQGPAPGFVALSVRDDADWQALLAVVADDRLRREDLRTMPGRQAAHDELDAILAEWAAARTAAQAEAELLAAGLPAARILTPALMYDDPQLDAVGYYQPMTHPVTGERRYPGWPARHSAGPASHHRFMAPTLGQHNAEILGALGLSEDELQVLRADGLIGDRLPDANR